MSYYVKTQTINGSTTETNLNDLTDGDIYAAASDLLNDCEGFNNGNREKVSELHYRNDSGDEIFLGEILSADEIHDHLSEIGETGSYKVERNSLYTQREENCDWLFCGAVINRNQVQGVWDGILAAM